MTSNSSREELCQLAADIHRSPRILLLNLVHIVVCVCTFISIVFYVKTPSTKRALRVVLINLKIILYIGILFFCLGLSSSLVVNIYRIFMYLFNKSKCDFVWQGHYCVRATMQLVFVNPLFYPLFHASLLLERIIAVCVNQHRTNLWLGLILGAIILLWPHLFGLYSYLTLPPMDEVAYCSGIILNRNNSYQNALQFAMQVIGLDVAITIADFLLLLHNKHQIKRYYRSVSDLYTLNRSFELKEIRISLQLVYPLTFSHSISFALQYAIYFFYMVNSANLQPEANSFYKECTNMVRSLGIFAQMVALCVYHRTRREDEHAEWERREDATDLYFDEFKRMIG